MERSSSTTPARRWRRPAPLPAEQTAHFCRIRKGSDMDPDPFFRCAYDDGFDRGAEEDIHDVRAVALRAWRSAMVDYPFVITPELERRYVDAYSAGYQAGAERRITRAA